ncbi:protein NIM1-INTERACTING 1 [Punica granatum]|uniref:Protein NIM1-INTERACTING 1 n=2 Tax=Punica granatum TaxID=22663 RepID=A0A6P8EFE9_PUNGR|nr:protein NIM1-INTERACTING 1 [Punica granatum]PKI44541.1 hypothetical protein CRG98_035079 [Punica granatum]
MEGDGRKRKVEDEEESEEEKMEKFFALIRSTREMRDRLRGGTSEPERENKEGKAGLVWKPTFEPGDFVDDDKSKSKSIKAPAAAEPEGPSESRKDQEEDKTGTNSRGFDLNLSL